MSTDGLTSRCKECLKADLKRSHQAHRDRRLESMGQYREANQDLIKEWNRQWRIANREYLNEYQRKWRDENLERARESERNRHRAKRKSDPLFARLHQGVNRARRAGAPAEIFTTVDLLAHWKANGIDPHKCFYCPGPFEDLDHAYPLVRDGSPGHVVGNVVPSCLLCNNKKGKLTDHEYRSTKS